MKPFVERKRMTQLGEAVTRVLRQQKKPIIEDIDIWLVLQQIYKEKKVKYLRGDSPTASTLDRVKSLLRSERVISRDEDYKRSWRVNELPDITADEAVCLVDRGTCVSHLSAMQVYKISERRPKRLYLTIASSEEWKEKFKDKNENLGQNAPTVQRRHHPARVRSRMIDALTTKNFPATTQLRNSFVRVTEIGQTFLDMLEDPNRCGGMSHVIDVYRAHAEKYFLPIVSRIDQVDRKLTKVRAGYIFDELLHFHDPRVDKWVRFAQRGGSQKLDPKAEYANHFSEKWMLSLNV